jgi:ATP-dependent DNA ligase
MNKKTWPTLYSKGSKGEIRVWDISVEDNNVIISHGVKGGKIVTKVTQSFGKNKGKSNETTDLTQALADAEAKFVKQQKKTYFLSEKEATHSVDLTPMLLHKWEDHSNKISYPAYIQLKVDGNRCFVDDDVNAWSRAREPYVLPRHIKAEIEKVKILLRDSWYGLDGEIYEKNPHQGGLPLQEIVSAFRKENENTQRLKLWIFDVPKTGEPFSTRLKRLQHLNDIIAQNKLKSLVVVPGFNVNSRSELETINTNWVVDKEEGSVVRNYKGVYEFGGRSYDALKIKSRSLIEAKVLGYAADKGGEAVLRLALESGVQFNAKALKSAELHGTSIRTLEGADNVVGLFVEVEYEDFSLEGTPLKPVIQRVRSVQETPSGWVVKE